MLGRLYMNANDTQVDLGAEGSRFYPREHCYLDGPHILKILKSIFLGHKVKEQCYGLFC